MGGPFVTCVNLLNFESLKVTKKSSNYVIVKCEYVSQLSAVFGNNFHSKHLRCHLDLAYIVEQVKSLCLLVNNLDTPSYHLSLNDSNETEHVKSEMIRDKENNHDRVSQKKNKQDDAIFRLLSFFLFSRTAG